MFFLFFVWFFYTLQLPAELRRLSLTLFVTNIRTDDTNDAAAPNYAALVTHTFYRGSNFHCDKLFVFLVLNKIYKIRRGGYQISRCLFQAGR